MTRRTTLLSSAVIAAVLLLSSCGGDEPSGPRVRLVIEPEPGAEAGLQMDLSDALEKVASAVRSRLSAFDITGATVEREGDRRVVIEMPGTEEDALAKIGRALLQFCEPLMDEGGNIAIVRTGTVVYEQQTCRPARDADDAIVVEGGGVEFVRWPPTDYSTNDIVWTPAVAVIDGEELELTGEFLLPTTFVAPDQLTGSFDNPTLVFEWDSTGSEISGEVTQRLVDQNNLPLAPFFDGEPILGEDGRVIAPAVQSRITSQGQISGLSLQEAQNLSILLNAGIFPIAMWVVEVQEVED